MTLKSTVQTEGLPDYYHGVTVEHFPEQEGLNGYGRMVRGPAFDVYHGRTDNWGHPPLNPAQFQSLYHGSQHEFAAGDEISTARELNPEDPEQAAANPFEDPGERSYDTTYATSDLNEARSWGKNVYRVTPMGAMFPDRTGISSRDFEVEGHLKVLGGAA